MEGDTKIEIHGKRLSGGRRFTGTIERRPNGDWAFTPASTSRSIGPVTTAVIAAIMKALNA